MKYTYRIVSGASVWGPESPIASRLKALPAIRAQYEDAEIERVLHLDKFSRRYWRWRDGKWSFKNTYDPTPKDLEHWLVSLPLETPTDSEATRKDSTNRVV